MPRYGHYGACAAHMGPDQQNKKTTTFASATAASGPQKGRLRRSRQETIYRKAAGSGIRIRYEVVSDASRVEGVAPVDYEAIEDPFLSADFFIQGSTSVYVSHSRLVRSVLFFFDAG